jgi:hypothetical protein
VRCPQQLSFAWLSDPNHLNYKKASARESYPLHAYDMPTMKWICSQEPYLLLLRFQASLDIWLSVWTKAEAETHEPSMEYYMSVYVALGLAAVANYFLRRLALILATLRASQARFCLTWYPIWFYF